MYAASQNGITCLLSLRLPPDQAKACVERFPSVTKLERVHFLSFSLVRLAEGNGEPTDLLIEANFDGMLKELTADWADEYPNMVTDLFALAGEGEGGEPGRQSGVDLERLLSGTNHGTGTWYVALSGVSTEDIQANRALSDTCQRKVSALPSEYESPFEILDQLRQRLGQVNRHSRSVRVRLGPIVFSLVQKALLVALLTAFWVASRLFEPMSPDFSAHVTTALTLGSLFGVVLSLDFLAPVVRRPTSSALAGSWRWLVLLVVSLGWLSWLASSAYDHLSLLVAAVGAVALWPGVPILVLLQSSEASHPEAAIKRTTIASLIALVALLALVAFSGSLLAKAAILILTTVAVLLTGLAAILEVNPRHLAVSDVALVVTPPVLATLLAGGFTDPWLPGLVAIVAIALPHLALYELTRIRAQERSYRGIAPPTFEQMDRVREREDSDEQVQNHLVSVTRIEPKRLLALRLVLGYTRLNLLWTRHSGTLGGVRTIHFARWVVVRREDTHFLLFISNYSGSFDAYLDEFIDSLATGLNLIWGPTTGYPPTHWLVEGGANRREEFKRYARSSQSPTLYHYSAYPDLTVDEIEHHMRLREALGGTVPDAEAARVLGHFRRS